MAWPRPPARAGLGTVHAHRLRHSAATAILASGGSLAEIGQVLRHRRPADHRNLCEGEHRGAAVPRAPVAGSSVMTGMRQALAGYLDLRRGLGFKLAPRREAAGQFIAWPEGRGASTVTAADALAWAILPGRAASRWRRSGCRWSAASPATWPRSTRTPRFPRPGCCPAGRRAVPYLYSAADIAALMAQARQLRTRLRPATIATLIGLLAVTGMRIGEAIALDDDDFDPARQLLLVRHAKFGRDRLLPLHPTAAAAVQDYRHLRDQAFPRPVSEALLVSSAGTRLRYENVSRLSPAWPARRAWHPGPAARRPAPARPAAFLRGRHPAGLVPRRRQRRGAAAAAVGLPRPCRPGRHLLVPAGFARIARRGRPPPRTGRIPVTAAAATIQAFFTERLARQRRASPHTVAAYRDTLRMLLAFASARAGKPPCRLDFADLDAPLISAFLDHLEHERGNSIRTRNARLAAIHSLFGYAALRHPEHAADIERVLAIPPKRADQHHRHLPHRRLRPTRCSRPRTGPPAPAAVTTPGCCSRSRPGCGPPNSPAWPAPTSTSAPAPTSPATARAARTGSPR